MVARGGRGNAPDLMVGPTTRGIFMKYAAVALACLVPLAACNNSPEVSIKNASVSEAAKAVGASGAGGNFMRAGQWRVTSSLEDINMPGMPASEQSQMKRMMGAAQNASVEFCVTPEEARHPTGKMFSGKESDNCRFDHLTIGGGKFDMAMRCQSGSGTGSMTMQSTGTYSADVHQSHVAMNVEGGRRGSMSMKLRSEARRIGECTGGDKVKVVSRGG
jgi:hypothetical protein